MTWLKGSKDYCAYVACFEHFFFINKLFIHNIKKELMQTENQLVTAIALSSSETHIFSNYFLIGLNLYIGAELCQLGNACSQYWWPL